MILKNTDLSKIGFANKDLIDCDCSEVNFSGSDLSGFNLEKTNFEDAQLQGTIFHGCEFRYSTIAGANLGNAKLQGADLSTAFLNPYEGDIDDYYNQQEEEEAERESQQDFEPHSVEEQKLSDQYKKFKQERKLPNFRGANMKRAIISSRTPENINDAISALQEADEILSEPENYQAKEIELRLCLSDEQIKQCVRKESAN